MKKIILLSGLIFCFSLILVSPTFCRAGLLSHNSKKIAVEYREKGLAAQKMGDLDTALAYFQKAVELDPTMAIAYNDIGVVYEAKGWPQQAKEAYARAIEVDPVMPGPYYNLGILFEREGDFEKAVIYLKKRVLIGDWNDEWTAKARQELKALGVDDPEIKAGFLQQHLLSLEMNEGLDVEPKGNDLDPRRRKRDAKLRLLRAKQLLGMGMNIEALREATLADILDPKNKEIRKTLEEISEKTLHN